MNSIKVRTAQLLVERGAMPPVITRASVVGAERSQALFDAAYREHARRIARAIARERLLGQSTRGGGAAHLDPVIPPLPRASRSATRPDMARRRHEEGEANRKRPRQGSGAWRSSPSRLGGASPPAGRGEPERGRVGSVAAARTRSGYSNSFGIGNGFREEQLCTAKAEALASGQVTSGTWLHQKEDATGSFSRSVT